MQAPQQSFAQNQKEAIHVKVLSSSDGVTEDTTTPLVVSSGSPPVCQASVDPVDNRKVWLQNGSVPGSTNITVTTQNNPNPLIVPVTVTQPANLSAVEFVSADPPVPRNS